MEEDLFGYTPPDDSEHCEALRSRLRQEPDLIEKWEAIADEALAKGWLRLDADWILAEYKQRHNATCAREIRTGIMRVLIAKRPDLGAHYFPTGSIIFDRKPRP
jgi:hypothetical protein